MPTVNFYVSAVYTSPPTSMGGNTKILLELINHLYRKYNFIILTSEPKTFENGLSRQAQEHVKIEAVPYPFNKLSFRDHINELIYISKYYLDYFSKVKISSKDYFYSSSDFAPDVVPIYLLKKRHRFKWIASLFLFIPSPLENLTKHYGFPPVKYAVYYLYQRIIFLLIVNKMNFCVLTNDADKSNFPKSHQRQCLALYGGVNTEQIYLARKNVLKAKKYDAVFCGRLHPQKGIAQLLDSWRLVVNAQPEAKLAVIGNGEPSYEKFLRAKAKTLGLENNIRWLGYINNLEKYSIYLTGKIFLHASAYDNNGMVAAEALCTGLPVVMYDLPYLRYVYTAGCKKIKPGDGEAYAQAIIKMLGDKTFLASSSPSAAQINKYQAIWDWQHKARQFSNFV